MRHCPRPALSAAQRGQRAQQEERQAGRWGGGKLRFSWPLAGSRLKQPPLRPTTLPQVFMNHSPGTLGDVSNQIRSGFMQARGGWGAWGCRRQWGIGRMPSWPERVPPLRRTVGGCGEV